VKCRLELAPFRALWANPTWTAPFVSVMADAGMVVAMTADGGVVEGRAGHGT
jgi:hypothetical protein